jgi:TRAP-type mannitol/chloroaromatic compound transport system permease large subunit
MIYVITYAYFKPSIAPKPLEEEVPPIRVIIVQLLTSFVPLALLIMSVLGSILFGLATPAEAAAIGASGGLFLAFCYKSLTWTGLKQSVFLTAKTTAMVCWLFVGSWTFASIFSYLGGHAIIEHWILGLHLEPWQFLVLVQLIIFLLGWPLEWTEILIIFVPIFLPMLDTFGVNPYFFAMLIALNLQTSFLTPPMAMAAYYLKGVVGDQIELMEIFKSIFPYLAIVIFTMVLMYNFPGMALFLPDYFFGIGK